MFTDGEQILGSQMLPENLHLRYRSLKDVGEETTIDYIFDKTIGAIAPVLEAKSSSQIYLDFDFRQSVKTYLYYTFTESILEIIIIVPIGAFIIMTIISFLNTIQFYKSLAQLIQRRYFHAIEYQAILKYRLKFETIQKALEGIDQFKPILEEIDKFLSVEYSNHTYEEISEVKNKMQVLDAMLPNLDELEVSSSLKNEHEKVKQSNKDKILEERSKFSLNEIVALVKQRVSIFGVFNLYDEVYVNNSQLQAQIDLSNTKLEFLYRLLDKKRKGKKAE